MSPAIDRGAVVITASASPEEIRVGDIITFKQPSAADPNRCVTHRVINITTNGNSLQFQTKGDANEDPDNELVDSSDLIGKVVLSIPYIGYIPNYVKTSMGFVVLIVIPAILLITFEAWNIIKIQRGNKEEKKQINTKQHSSNNYEHKNTQNDLSFIHKSIDNLPSKTKKDKQTIICPKCKTKVAYDGKAGQTIIIICPVCDNEGFVTIEETNITGELKEHF